MDKHNQCELLAATAATAASSSSSPPPSSDAQMIGDWTLVATNNLTPRVGKRKDGCNETKTIATIKEEMMVLMIVGRRLPHTTINL
jgi:hypothetical protein